MSKEVGEKKKKRMSNNAEKKDELENALETMSKLNDLSEKELNEQIEKNPINFSKLLMAYSAFAERTCGNQNKVGEMIEVIELRENLEPGKFVVIHNKVGNKEDISVIEIKTGITQYYEVKTSFASTGKTAHCNWNFTIKPALLEAYMNNKKQVRKPYLFGAIVEDIYRKQKKGYVIIVANRGTQCLARYYVSGEFLALYLAKTFIANNSCKANIGASRCKDCGAYHRVKDMLEYGMELDQMITDEEEPFDPTKKYFSKEKWSFIMADVGTHCGKVKQ